MAEKNIKFTATGLDEIVSKISKVGDGANKKQVIKVDADTKTAESNIKKVSSKKETSTIKVDADTRTATDKINKLSASVANASSKITSKTSGITGGLGGITGAAVGMGAGFVGIQKGADIMQSFLDPAQKLAKQTSLTKDLFGELPPNIENVAKSMRMSKADTLALVNDYGLLAKGNGLAGKTAEEFAIKTAQATRNIALGSKKDIGEVQGLISSFLKTGRTAGLETLGIDLTKLEDAKSKMSETEFATKGLDLILEQMPPKWNNISETQNTYGANTERLNAKLEDSKASFGTLINDGLNKFASVLIDLDTKFPGFINLLTGVTFALGALAVILGIAALASFALSAAMLPITLTVLGIAAAIALIILLFQNWGAIVGFFSKVWGDFAKFVSDALAGAGNWITQKWNELIGFFQSVPGMISSFFSGIGQKIGEFFNAGVENIKNMFFGLIDWFKSIPQRIADIFSNLGGILKQALGYAIDFLPGLIRDPLKNALGLFDTDFKQILESAGTITVDASRFDFLPSQIASQTYNNQQSYVFNKGIESPHERTKLRVNMKKVRGR